MVEISTVGKKNEAEKKLPQSDTYSNCRNFCSVRKEAFFTPNNQFAVVKTDLAGTVIDVWSTLGR